MPCSASGVLELGSCRAVRPAGMQCPDDGDRDEQGYEMTDEVNSDAHVTLHPIVTELAEALARDAGSRAEIVRGDNHNWLAIEETSSTITFVEAEGAELRVVPFVGDYDAIGARSFVSEIRPSWLDGERELVADVSALSSYADRGQVIDLMHAALDYWTRSAATPSHEPPPVPAAEECQGSSEASDVDFADDVIEGPDAEAHAVEQQTIDAQMRADISDQWSWASSVGPHPADLRPHRRPLRGCGRTRESLLSCTMLTFSSAPRSRSRVRCLQELRPSAASTCRSRRVSCRRSRSAVGPTASSPSKMHPLGGCLPDTRKRSTFSRATCGSGRAIPAAPSSGRACSSERTSSTTCCRRTRITRMRM